MIKLKNFDNGKEFDFGRVSEDYGKYRDIYTKSFYDALLFFGIGHKGQNILDLGTGSGVLPRNMYEFGANFTGADISPDQIEQAKKLSANMDIKYMLCGAEEIPFADNSFDVVTACQCFWYFDTDKAVSEINRVLKAGGKLAILSMIGLPHESKILAKSEELVLKYSPEWTGGHFNRATIRVPNWTNEKFRQTTWHTFLEDVPFTIDSWCGRMRACRGVGASLLPEKVAEFDREHREMLKEVAGENFTIPHQYLFSIFEALK